MGGAWDDKMDSMSKISVADLAALSLSERIQLVEDIWDSIATTQERPPLTNAQSTELDRRLDAHGKNPTAGSPWAEVKQQVVGRK